MKSSANRSKANRTPHRRKPGGADAAAITKGKERVTALPLRIKSILLPIDFSEPSRKIFGYAVLFAEKFGAKVTLLHVIEPFGTPHLARAFPLVREIKQITAVDRKSTRLNSSHGYISYAV